MLQTRDGLTWTGTVQIPEGTVLAWKLVVLEGDTSQWEDRPNRHIAVTGEQPQTRFEAHWAQ